MADVDISLSIEGVDQVLSGVVKATQQFEVMSKTVADRMRIAGEAAGWSAEKIAEVNKEMQKGLASSFGKTIKEVTDEMGKSEAAAAKLAKQTKELDETVSAFGNKTLKAMKGATEEVTKGKKEMGDAAVDAAKKQETLKASTVAVGIALFEAAKMAANWARGVVIGSAEAANAIMTSADVAGISTDRFQELSVAAALAGENAGRMDQAFTGLAQKISASLSGSKEAANAFKQIGLDPKKFKDSEDAIEQVLQKLGEMPAGFARTEAAADLFGRRLGTTMIQIAEQAKLAKDITAEFKLGLTPEELARLEDFRKSMVTMQLASEAFQRHLAAALAPALKMVIEQLLRFSSEGDISGTIKSIADSFIVATSYVLEFAAGVKNGMTIVIGAVSDVAELIGIFANVIVSLPNVIAGVIRKANAIAPGGLIRALITGENPLKAGDELITPVLDGLAGSLKEFRSRAKAAVESAAPDQAAWRALGDKLRAGVSSAGKDFWAEWDVAANAGVGRGGGFGKVIDKEAEAAVKSLERMRDAMIESLVKTAAGDEAALRFKLTHGELAKAVGATADKLRETIVALYQEEQALKLAEQSAKKYADTVLAYDTARAKELDAVEEQENALKKQIITMNETATAYDRYVKGVERVKFLMSKGLETEPAREEMKKLAKTYEEETNKMSDETRELTNAIVGGLGNAFEEVGKGTFKFSDYLRRLESQLLDIGNKILILNPAAKEMARIFNDLETSGGGKGSGLGGIWQGILNKVGIGGGAAVGGAAAAAGGGFDFASAAATMFDVVGGVHSGGIAGSAGATRYASRGLFRNAVRLHDGLASDEFPAILQKGERVIPKSGERDAMPSVVNNNYFTVQGNVDRRAQEQIGATVFMNTSRAARRNN